MVDNEKCLTCNVVKDSKITEEKYPLQKLDINVFYCEICGFLYIYDTDKQLDPIVNIKTKLLLPKLRSVIFGIDTRLIKSVNGILDKVREEEEIYSK